MNDLLQESDLLDYSDDTIQALIQKRAWKDLDEIEKIKAVYTFVRDEIPLGYNESDARSASEVLADGYGQCNTKAHLLMALLRALHVENRVHGFTVGKSLQKGVITGLAYFLSPKEILHTWVEVKANGQWFVLEGVVVDTAFLHGLQKKFSQCTGEFCGYAVHTETFQKPPIDWNLNDTYIQHKSIIKDLGVFNTPDELHARQRQNLNFVKEWIYKNIIRHQINKRVQNIRKR